MSSTGGFSIDQLMELGKLECIFYYANQLSSFMLLIRSIKSLFIAGLSVAQAVQKSFDARKSPNVLICVGPGKKKKWHMLLTNVKLICSNRK